MTIGLNHSTGLNHFMTSWKSGNDLGIGNYSFKIDPSGFPQVFLYKNLAKVWRAGLWTGQRLSGMPEVTHAYICNASFVNDDEEISFQMGTTNNSIILRVVVNETGFAQRYTWNPRDHRWIQIWSAPEEDCDKYGYCGPNSNCDKTQMYSDKFICSCLPGFEPKSPEAWFLRDGSAGCIQKPNASVCESGEGFVKVEHVKGYASAYYEMNGGTGCLTWHGEMVDIRTYTYAGQDFYVRVDAVDLARYRKNGGHNSKKLMMVAIVVVFVALICMAASAFYLRVKKRGRNSPSLSFIAPSTHFEESLHEKSAELLPLFDLETIAATTNNFSADNKLGQGGFGHVYKGSLKGMEVAIKRLSKSSGQGIEEFKNEITLIAKLQHRNLVRILGCCIEKEEKMLIYEYLPNKSLDSFIFDERKRLLLDWRRRYEIICGIARGIVYLHHDSRLRIIHRDLKASNVLLDAEMNPKISDFGMARIFGGDQVGADTKHVVGTYGYMAPEYAMQGHFSIKSDVYSFGVLLLEIVTGRRNAGSHIESPTLSLIGHVWDQWTNDKAIEVIDSKLEDSYPIAEVLRCIQIGLVCVQDGATDRPKMSEVVAMLGKEAFLPSPKQPAFIIKKANQGDGTRCSEGIASINEMTLTMPHGR
ncbi:S-locus glycoprotein [Corchorus olitorius]|uniref:non-specific serine/threonine protein kinase n=1 Tax=Corchorus olitorius TaxID=93759 RepID=A0A1R3GZ87_9ROSI|nr:S-locus glycoprotein [Corchorus olitorius]